MESEKTIEAEGFSAHYEKRDSAVVVRMKGNADMAVHDEVKAFLDGVHDAVRRTRSREAVFEFEELYFMNSSCLSLLLRFIDEVMNLKKAQQYTIRFRSNRNQRWQSKSLSALQAYAEDLVIVE